jgi:hypothetical protein
MGISGNNKTTTNTVVTHVDTIHNNIVKSVSIGIQCIIRPILSMDFISY